LAVTVTLAVSISISISITAGIVVPFLTVQTEAVRTVDGIIHIAPSVVPCIHMWPSRQNNEIT
jgi:hypothetical protein